jgi:hypothetical protein
MADSNSVELEKWFQELGKSLLDPRLEVNTPRRLSPEDVSPQCS